MVVWFLETTKRKTRRDYLCSVNKFVRRSISDKKITFLSKGMGLTHSGFQRGLRKTKIKTNNTIFVSIVAAEKSKRSNAAEGDNATQVDPSPFNDVQWKNYDHHH